MPVETTAMLAEFYVGYTKKVANLKQDGEMALVEGKKEFLHVMQKHAPDDTVEDLDVRRAGDLHYLTVYDMIKRPSRRQVQANRSDSNNRGTVVNV